MQAVIYARYSSHGQTEQSIEGQLRDCYAYAQREGMVVVGEYIDRAITGRTDDRPDFQRMISDAAKKQFQRIIVWKLDRFARNRYDSAFYKAKLKKFGVKVVSATEPISEEPEGIILEGLLESMAEYYSANLSKHVKRGQRESIIKGTFLGGYAPYGYYVKDNRLEIDERAAPIVREIFERYANGEGKTAIINDLTRRGIRAEHIKAFTHNLLSHMLKNEKYIGIVRHGGIDVVGTCPAIIDEKLFRRVQERINAAKRAPAAAKANVPYLLQGKAFCGLCGMPMVGESGRGKSGAIHQYYSCAARKKRHTCKKLNEKKGFLEWYVVEQTQQYVLQPDRLTYIADRLIAEHKNEFGISKIAELEKQSARLENDLNALVDSIILAPKESQPRIFARMEQLETQKADIDLNIASLKIVSDQQPKRREIIAWLKSFCRGDPIDPEFCERIIDVFVNAVYVFDDHLVIYYNIKEGKQVSYIEMLDSSTEPPNSEGSVDSGVRISVYAPRQSVPNSNPRRLIFQGRLFGFVVPLPARKK